MNLVEFSLKRRVTVSMAAVALVIFGFVSFTRLPMNLLPDISYPTLTVETRFPGAAPGEVETLVSRPIEEVVGIVAGVQRLTSVSRPGLSQVTLEFDWGRNMDFAALDVRQKLDLLTLPREIEKPVILRFDPANDPVLRLYLTGGKSLYQLRYVAEEILKKDLESTEGVAAIKVNGGYEEEIEVRVDEGKLALLGLTIQQVDERLRRENINQAGGSLYEKEARYLVRARNEFEQVSDIMSTVVLTRDGRNVTMADIAQVVRGHKQREVVTRFGGKEAVELAIYKEGDANIVSVARAVQARLERVKAAKEMPEGIEFVTGVDQSRFIRASIDEVLSNALLGGLIAIVVLLLFLKDLRSTIIIGVSIPISIIATFFLMYRTGTTLNIMSLGGLALGVGMLVDNAIVVLESIFKKREQGEGAFVAARDGAAEVGMAVVASTLTTVAVFLPVVFLEGIAAQLFRDQALTVSFSLIASLAVSLTLIPMMAALSGGRSAGVAPVAAPETGGRARRIARAIFVKAPSKGLSWLRIGGGKLFAGLAWAVRPIARVFDRTFDTFMSFYPHVLRWSLRSRLLVLAVVTALFAFSLALVPRLGVDLIPSFTQGEFNFQVQLPEGTPLDSTDRFIAGVSAILENQPNVASYSAIAGGAGLSLSNTGTEGENTARIQVQMKPEASAEDEEVVIAAIREKLEGSQMARFKFERPTYFTFRTPIEVEVYSDDLAELQTATEALRGQIEQVPGLVDVKTSAELGNPEVQVSFNRNQLAQLGLDLTQVATTVRNKIQGSVATRFTQGDREIDIVVRSVEVGEGKVGDIRQMIVGHSESRPIYLSSVADIQLVSGPSEIRRIGQKRAAVISGNLFGRDMGAVAADVREILRSAALPGTVTATLSGQEEEMQRSMRSLMLAMALAIFLVYLVMASQFESFLHPFVIIFTLPLAAIGVVIALAATGRSISIVAMIGVVMLAGIVVNNAIVLIDAVNQLRQKGIRKEDALIQAGMNRMRPILMTSLTTILGLLPMAIGLGEGAELRAPLAITVIGGLTVATLLTLIVIPVVYSLLDRKVYEADRSVVDDEQDAISGEGEGSPVLS
ncbi:MAG TPA: efflux RND transporter permease subunit [Thermoanaerobaculia bacterium]|nr:efflux RND transporter permease subunit [Thermoanaerobaculia bacterium]